MHITKLEALALSKALHSLGLTSHSCGFDRTSDTLIELAKRVDVYLLCGSSEDAKLVNDPTPCFEAPDLEKEAPEEEHDSFVSGSELHNLRSVTSDGLTFEFELHRANGRQPARVDLLQGGACVVEDVSALRRQGKKLLVRSHGNPEMLKTFSVTKFSKDWISALPLDELVGVET